MRVSTSEEGARRRNNEGNHSFETARIIAVLSRKCFLGRKMVEIGGKKRSLAERLLLFLSVCRSGTYREALSLLARGLVLNIRFFNTFLSLIKLVHVFLRTRIVSTMLSCLLVGWSGCSSPLINKLRAGKNYFEKTLKRLF